MIVGVGTDIAQVARFNAWLSFSREQLSKIFSDSELSECGFARLSAHDQAQKLAVRFAAKEAFFKALSAALVQLGFTETTFSFLFLCKQVQVIKQTWEIPQLCVDWQAFERKIGKQLPKFTIHLSLAHERLHVVAFVVLVKEC
ncbi:4'-phosphopantetheinyl transferase superfamily protein [Candidatus Babeliales bacterium]|nr:4'-phosphopantetheinyl transferase superfamily protein [Candidatus Babeliales bacterium]